MQLASGKESMKVLTSRKTSACITYPTLCKRLFCLQDYKPDALVLCNKQKMAAKRRVFLGKSIKFCVLLTI